MTPRAPLGGHRILPAFALGLLLSTHSTAQELAEEVSVADPQRDRPVIGLRLERDVRRITDTITVLIEVQNPTETVFDVFSEAHLYVEDEIARAKPGYSPTLYLLAEDAQVKDLGVGEGLAPVTKRIEDRFQAAERAHGNGDSGEGQAVIDRPSSLQRFLRYAFDGSVLLFQPGQYRLTCRIRYREQTTEVQRYVEQSILVALEPPLYALYHGGVLGALLLTLLLAGYRGRRLLRNPRDHPISVRGAVKAAGELLLQFVLGSVVACCVILLMKESASFKLPIAIELNHYLGGVVVGLFSYKLGDVLYERLVGDRALRA